MFSLILNALAGGNFSIWECLAYILSSVAIIMLILPLHELAHGFIADKLGDPTARYAGRLTLNPFAHIDWLGAAFIMLFGFGWAKPVPVNMRNFDKPKAGMALTALAGPLSNLIAGFIGMGLNYGIVTLLLRLLPSTAASFYVLLFIGNFFNYFIIVNITLAVFNMIPIPPLDGSRLLSAFLPDRAYYKLMELEKYSFVLLAIIFATDVFDPIIYGTTNGILNLFDKFWALFL